MTPCRASRPPTLRSLQDCEGRLTCAVGRRYLVERRSLKDPWYTRCSITVLRAGAGAKESPGAATDAFPALVPGILTPTATAAVTATPTSTPIPTPTATAAINATATGNLVPGEVVNKVPVALSMTPSLYGYLLSHTREPEVLRQLREETAAMHGGHMQITPEQGALLGLLVELVGARRVVEVGVFTGYSSCAMALALPPDGRLAALDRDERPLAVARRFWQRAGVADRVEVMLGSAADSLEQLLGRDGPGSYDMAFIDADKRAYDKYYELLLQLVRPGGLIAIDNTLFYGRVVEPKDNDKPAVALRNLNSKLLGDLRVTVSIVPIGDGMTLCRRR